LSKINQKALDVAHTGLEALALPIEIPGEIIRGVVENPQAPLSDFRAPSIIQRAFPSTQTNEPPAFIADTANKLLRGGAGAVDAAVRGSNILEGARASYNAPRGTMGTVEDTALSLLMGKIPTGTGVSMAEAPMRVASEAIGSVTRGAKSVAKGVGKGAIRVALGPTAENQSLLFRRPNEVKGALMGDDLADKFASTVNDLSVKVGELDDVAWDSLLKLKSESRAKILKTLEKVRHEFVGTGKSKIGDADLKAVSQIDRYIERTRNIKQAGVDPKLDQMLDQHQLRDIVQSVRKDARFDLPETDPTNRAVQAASAKLDAMLKDNGNYAEVMDRLAPATKSLKEAASKFRLKREPGVGFTASDTTAQKLILSGRKNKPETRKILDRLKQQTGEDFLDQAKLAGAKEAFTPGTENSRGSARTAFGALAGLAAEPFVPGKGVSTIVGGAVGRTADYYGGAMAGKLIDALRSGNTAVAKVLNAAKTAKGERSSSVIELIKELTKNPSLITSLRRQTE
jgi:hypothetical protein